MPVKINITLTSQNEVNLMTPDSVLVGRDVESGVVGDGEISVEVDDTSEEVGISVEVGDTSEEVGISVEVCGVSDISQKPGSWFKLSSILKKSFLDSPIHPELTSLKQSSEIIYPHKIFTNNFLLVTYKLH
jgi:hypothetical protein